MSCTSPSIVSVSTLLTGVLNVMLALSQVYFLRVLSKLDCECKNVWLALIQLYTFVSIMTAMSVAGLCASNKFTCALKHPFFKYYLYCIYALNVIYFLISFLTVRKLLNKDCNCVVSGNFMLFMQAYETSKKLILSMGAIFFFIVLLFIFPTVLYYVFSRK